MDAAHCSACVFRIIVNFYPGFFQCVKFTPFYIDVPQTELTSVEAIMCTLLFPASDQMHSRSFEKGGHRQPWI